MGFEKWIVLFCLLSSSMPCFAKSTQSDLNESLVEAVEKNNLVLVKRLIAQGAQVNAKIEGDQTPLISAIEGHEKVTLVLRYLVKCGADVNMHTKNGWNETPLYTAAHYPSIKIVKFLLQNGAKINEIESNLGDTTLNSLCCICGGCGCITDSVTANALVNLGANVDIPNYQGNSPLMTLILTAPVHGGEETEDLVLAKNLIRHSKKLNQKNKNGKTALQLALQQRWWPVAHLIKQEISSR